MMMGDGRYAIRPLTAVVVGVAYQYIRVGRIIRRHIIVEKEVVTLEARASTL